MRDLTSRNMTARSTELKALEKKCELVVGGDTGVFMNILDRVKDGLTPSRETNTNLKWG